MKSSDGRKLTHDKLTELRRRGVAAIQAGESPELFARALQVNRSTAYGWLALYRRNRTGIGSGAREQAHGI
jgi:transposase